VKAMLGFYIGGMGAKQRNFHKELMGRMGFEAEATRIQQLFFEGKRAEAIAAVPDQFADEVSLVGPIERIRDRLQAWKQTPVTTLLVPAQDPAVMRKMAELVPGRRGEARLPALEGEARIERFARGCSRRGPVCSPAARRRWR
jgi:hypothetical protein